METEKIKRERNRTVKREREEVVYEKREWRGIGYSEENKVRKV